MAFDACMMRGVLFEFSREFSMAKIDKVLQPQSDEIALMVRSGKSSGRLVFNLGPTSPRLQLSGIQKENPEKPPMFCMLLRKLLSGAKIVSAEQLGFDRIAVFHLACYDEMGFPTERKIVSEIMGKYSNFIVLDKDDKIIAALKPVDFAASTVRQVLPGLKYQIPAQQPKINPLVIDRELFFAKLSEFPEGRTAEKFITSTYSGIATQIAHELAYRASGNIDTPLCEIDKNRFGEVFFDWQSTLINHEYSPTAAVSLEGGPVDYSYMNISYLSTGAAYRKYDTLGTLMDEFFAERDRIEHVSRRARDITTLINNAEARIEKKLNIQTESLIESERGEEYKRLGDLITANIYRIKRGQSSFAATDYFKEGAPEIEVPLDTRLSPSQNAQKMYKLYNKCKTARVVLAEQISLCKKELSYLESVRAFLERAEREDDIAEIRDELYRSGYASKMRGYMPPRKLKSSPIRLKTSGGFALLVGKNNVQNDNLSHKSADKNDIWFHVKDAPGSHVILVSEGREPSERDYTEAAMVAAKYSKLSGDNIAVDYTRVKNLKKPAGSKPGFVTYKTNYTAYVREATDEEILALGTN